ncbi:MAG: tetratricopeptide repeat protein [Deltaproteobacteria bacterium]|nr:tetratricopeptide repeat protein [Deltaproteobacteria bacterium]
MSTLKEKLLQRIKTLTNRCSRFLPHTLITLITSIAYAPSFRVPFIFDDTSNIDEKAIICNPGSLKDFFLFSNRPVADAVSWFNFQTAYLNVKWYHITNLAIYLITGFLLFQILVKTIDREGLLERLGSRRDWAAVILTLLFMVLPVHTQAITYIVQGRMTGLATMFYLAGLALFLAGVERQGCRSRLYYLGSWFSLLLAMGSKEIAITAPAMILLYDLFFVSRWDLSRLAKRKWVHLALFSTIGYVVWLQFHFNYGPSVGVGFKEASSTSGVISVKPFNYLISQFEIIIYYFKLLVWPTGLRLDYYWLPAKNITEFRVWGSFLLILGAVIFAVRLSKRNRLMSFGVFWYFITLSPESSFIPLADLIFEHRAYLPSVGYIFFLAGLAGELHKAPAVIRRPKVALASVILLLAVYGGLTFSRNLMWTKPLVIWEDNVAKAPGLFRPLTNLGATYLIQNRVEDARRATDQAVAVRPHPLTLSNLGLIYNRLGQPQRAKALLGQALKISPNNASVLVNMAQLIHEQGDTRQAIELVEKAIKNEPSLTNAYVALARMWVALGSEGKAVAVLRRALVVNPKNHLIFDELGHTYKDMGMISQAKENFLKAIKLKPDFKEGRVALADIYRDQGDFAATVKEYQELLDWMPEDADVLSRLGALYIATYELPQAEKILLKAYKLHPDHQETTYNLGTLYFTLGQLDLATELYLKTLPQITTQEKLGEVLNALGLCYLHTDRPKESLAYFAESVEICPNNPETHFNCALAASILNDYQVAASEYRLTLDLNPNHQGANQNLGIIYSDYLHDPVLAKKYLQRSLALAAPGPDTEAVKKLLRQLEVHAQEAGSTL